MTKMSNHGEHMLGFLFAPFYSPNKANVLRNEIKRSFTVKPFGLKQTKKLVCVNSDFNLIRFGEFLVRLVVQIILN